MAKKYWWEEDENQTTNQTQAEQKPQNQEKKTYWWEPESVAATIGGDIASQVNAWIERNNAYLSDYQKRFSGRKYNYDDAYVSDSASWLDSFKEQGKSLNKDAQSILDYVDQYKDYLDADWVDSVTSTLNSTRQHYWDLLNGAKDDNKYWSQWETEDDYNKDVATAKDYEAKSTADLDALSKELEQLDLVANEFATVSNQYFAVTNNPSKFSQDQIDNITAKYFTLVNKYGTPEDFNAKRNEKKLFVADAKRIQEGITLSGVINNDDFNAYSGYASTEYDSKFAKMSSQYGLGYEDLTYEYINGAENGMRSEIRSKIRSYSSDTKRDQTDKYTIYDQMSEDEISVYNYYYAKDGKEAAQKYLDNLEYTLNAREATEMFSAMEDKTLLELAFGVAAGLDQFESGMEGLWNAVTGNDEYQAPSSIQMASGMVREDLKDVDLKWYNFKEGAWGDAKIFGNSLGQTGYDAITTTSNMLPSILTSAVANAVAPGSGAVLGTALLGSSAGGNAYQEMINLGYDKGQARNYAVLVGGSEAILQYVLGGISSLSGGSEGIFQSIAGKWLPHVDKAFARVAIQLGSNMLDEGLEEGIQEILDPWFKNLTLQTNENVNWSEVAYSSLLGALTAGFMEGPTTIAGEVKTYKTGKKLQAKDFSAQRLADIGHTFSADTVAYQLADKVNENTGAYTMGRLFNEIGASLSTQNVNEITTELMKRGMDAETAKANAEALAYVVEGGQLSSKQIAIIEANDVLASVARATLIDANTTWNQRSKGYNDMLKALAEEMTAPKPAKAKQAEQGKENAPVSDTVDTQKENGVDSLPEAESVDTSPAKVSSIADVKKRTIKLEDGSEVNVKDADLSPDDGVRIETIASIDGISTEDANFILNTLRTNTGASAQMDSLGAKEAFKYGFYGLSQDHMTKHGVFANSLTDTQRQAIYEAGQKARQKQIESASPKATTKERGIYFDHGNGNVVAFKDTNKSAFSEDKRKAGVQAAIILHKLGIGGDIYFFESYINANGKRVYKDANGVEKKAPNGWYSESDSSIHIDLNAGNKGDGLVLFTLAHELTHFIEKWSPQKYKVLADFLIENYEQGQSMDKLVRAKQAQLSANRNKKVSYDEAYSEVIADSMEAMLADGNVMEKILELKAKDEGLVAKIKQFFENLLVKIRNTYKDLTPDSEEGQAVQAMTESIEKIQQLFAEALVEASENFHTAQAQFSTDSIRGNADGAVAQSEVTTALVEATDGEILKSERTEYEALPKQVMSLSDGSGKLLNFIEGLKPKELNGLSGRTTNGYTGRAVRAYAMGISGFTEEQIQNVNEFMDAMSKFMDKAGVTYKFIGLKDVKDAKLHYTYNADGSIKSIVLSAMVKNGDYPVNFDLSSICKKRVAMSKLIDKLATRGSLDSGTVKLTPANIFKINTALKNEGYETACLGCFVESKRYNSLEWAKTFCNKWNAAVKKVNPNATYFGYGDNTFNEDSFTLEQAVKIDEAATKYLTTTKVERLANALKKYKAREQAGLPLVEKFSDAAKKRLVKSDTISDELKDKYLNIDLTTLTMADVEFLLENEVLPGASLSNKQAVTEMVKSGEAYQHLLRPSDLLTDRGISKLEALPNFHGVLYGHYGSGTPKLMQSYTPYNSEIALLPANKNNDQTLAEYLYTIAGVRMQSFSDFQIQNIYDYLQMVADLAARKLPAHAYTKEISFAKLLGMTGIKVNLSVMFDIDPMVDKAHAGLTKLNKLVHRGEYAKVVLEDEQGKWVYNIGDYQTQKLFAEAFPDEAKRFLQSIGFGDAVKLQSTPGYSANCGIIGVGYSDLGIFAMLDDNRIRYIIPYHASSLPAEIKVATNIALGTDYTSYQNNMKIAGIVDKNGNAVNWSIKEAYKRLGSGQAVINELNEKVRTDGWVVTTKKAQTGHGTYGLYEDLQQTNDPRQTAGNFMDWCIGNGTLPLFYQFASHDNYYKLLYDFNVYDCVTEEYAPQQAVTNTYPTMVNGQVQPGNVTDGGFDTEYFQGAIDKQMAFMDEYSRNLDEDLEELADNLEEGNYSLHSDRFEEDKYFARQIDKIGELRDGSYVTVGKIKLGSPIEKVGIPAGNLYFDVSKIRQEMFDRGDPIPPETIKGIPKVLDNPMVITEYFDKSGKPSINVYGKLYIGSSPVVIGIMIGKHRNGQSVDKIQTVHPNRHFLDEVTDNNTLYLGENKKETNAWFQALGAQEPPLGGTKYGFIRMLSQGDGNVKRSGRDSLTPDQQKHFDYNQKQKAVGSALKTLKGSSIKRSTKYGVGKEIGGEIYFHKNYAEDILPDEVLSQAMQLLEESHPGFEYNCLKYNPKTGVVAFQEAPDFDSAREPVVGDYVSVNTDTGVVKTGHSNYIWHHKWNWVKNDYSGFDVAESWNWSKQWLSTLTEVSDGNGIERWNAQLDRFGLPKDGESNLYSEREQEYDSKDTSVKILPATFTKFGLKATDRVLDWGGGQYDIAKKAIEHGYPGIKFEVVDAFNRTPTHNDRILAEYAENPATVLTINNVLNVIKETDIIEDVIRESKEYLAEDGVCYIKIYEGNDVDGKTGNGKVTSSGWQNNQPAEWYRQFAEKYYQFVERVGDILVASDKPIDRKTLPKVGKEVAGSMREKVKEIAKSEPSMRESLYSDRDFLADDNLKSNYTVSEIGEMFDAWNSNADTAELAKKVFAKLQSIQDEYTNADWGKPYGIRFATNERLEKAFYQAPLGVFKAERSSDFYGITYNLDRFKNFDDQRKANVLLHEAIHACTVNYIKSAESRIPKHIDVLNFKAGEDWSNEAKAGLALIQIFEQVRTAENRTEYGQKDAYEMTAELANPEFRDMLKKQGLWDRVVNAIKRILGIDSKANALDAASKALDQILEIDDVRYQDRADESVSNRSLLANAFEGLAQNDIEKNKIQEYKSKIELINSEEKKLSELNQQIKELSFAKGPRDTKKIRSLQFEANQTANRINTYDKQLLRLEASQPLQDVLAREKKLAYQRAEKKGKEALDKYKERAAKTQRELLEKWQDSRKKGIEGRNKTAMRHKIKDVVNELNQYLLKGTKDRHVPESLQKAVAEALNAVNMDTVGADERIAKLKAEMMKAKTPEQIQEISRKIDHIQEMGDRMNGRLKKLKDAYDDLLKSPDENTRSAYDEVIHNKLESVIYKIGNTPLRDMTLAQLEDVYDMYRMVLTAIRDVNKSFKDAKNQSISTRANAVMAQVEEVGGKHKLSAKILNGIKKFGWNNLKPVYAFEHIGSVTLTEAFKNVRAGEDVWALDVTEAREFYLDKIKKYQYDSWDFQKQYEFQSTSEMDFSLNLEQILSLYAYSKRDQAADHLKYGGIVFDESTKIIKKKLGIPIEFNPTEATAYNISEETLAEIIGNLTDEQKDFVDEMQDYLSTVMGAKGNEVSMAMYDIKLFKDKNYFPLKSAQQFMEKAREQQKGDVKIKNSGFSKETVPKAKNPIVLTPFMEVWSNHVNEMSMYHAFVLPLEDFYRIYNYKTPSQDETLATEGVNQYIQNAYGRAATAYIDQLLKDLNGGARTDSTTGFINKMMGLFKKGSVFASLSVVVQQPSAIARAVALVDTKYFVGPKVDHKRHKALWDEVKQYAPVAIIKEMGYFDTNMGKSTQDFILSKEYSGFKEKMKALVTDSNYRDEVLSKAPALADELAWCSIWEAVKRETQANNPNMDVKSEAFLKIAGDRFTEVITKTQVYDSVLSRSGMMRSKDTGMKMATAFMAEPTTSINMIADALLQGKRGHKKYARAAIGAVIASQILNSILVSFVYAGRDDDEDETYMEKYIGTLTGEIFDSLNPATYIPFIKDIVSIAQGYDVERSDMAVVSDLWKACENLKKDNLSPYRKFEGFVGSIAQIFGLPVKNIMRDARGIYQTIDSFVNGENTTGAGIGYAVKSAFPEWIGGGDVSKQDQLYEAYLSGDAEQIARVQGRFADQSAVNSAMRSAIKSRYDDGELDDDTAVQYLVEYGGMEEHKAYWRVEEWKYETETGEDFHKFDDFHTAVQTGKDLKAVIKSYTDHGVDNQDLAGEITSYFKPLYKEMSNTERAAIKGYLLNAYQLLGYNRYEKSKDIDAWLKD